MNLILGEAELNEKEYEMVFGYYDFRKIPNNVLHFLLKTYDEVYRKGYAVLFKFKSPKNDEWKVILDWMYTWDNDDEHSEDDYRYIVIEDNGNIENTGCMNEFNIEVKIICKHDNSTDINPNPCDLKATLLNDEDRFDLRVKKRGL